MVVSKEDRKKALRERTQDSVKNGDTFVKGKKGSVIDFKRITDDHENIKYYEPKHGKNNENHIDILPFVIQSKWYENLRTFNKNTCGVGVGHLDYKLEIPVHYDVGAAGETILCIREAFGHKCAVCDEMFELYAEANGKEKHKLRIQKLRPKWRCFYNVFDYDGETDEYLVWEMSYHNFESKLKGDAQTDDGGSVEFADPETGKTIVFRGNQKVLGKNEYVEAGDINFDEREAYDEEELLSETLSFDLGLKIPTEEDVRIMHQNTLEDEGGEESQEENAPVDRTTRRSRGKKTTTAAKADDNNPCPAGGQFGIDMNELPECQECGEISFANCEAENIKADEAGAGEPEQEEGDPEQEEEPEPEKPATPAKRTTGGSGRRRNKAATKSAAEPVKRKRSRK